MAGLTCGASKTCVPGSILLNPDLFGGAPCDPAADAALPFGPRTHIPRGDGADFYALPFPSDIRRKDGVIDLSEHPRPGSGLLGFDLVAAVAHGIEKELDGFGVNPGIYFRFSRPVDATTLQGAGSATPTVRLVDLDHGGDHPMTLSYTEARNKYACGSRLYVRPLWSRPLLPSTTYAAVLLPGIRANDAGGTQGVEAQAIEDLPMLLGGLAPLDAGLAKAWETHAKLRAWLAAQGIAPSAVVGATVFSTSSAGALLPKIKAAVDAAEPPTFDAPVTVCQPGVKSPCATPDWASTKAGQAGEADPRDCPSVSSAIHYELHTRMHWPVLQQGTRPYLDAGGEIDVSSGLPLGYESVCVAFTIPKAPMPAAGWPLVIYGHGTGGSFRSGAGLLGEGAAQITLDSGVKVTAATMGIDGPMHGTRRGGDTRDPGPLFYNFLNPIAAKGNLYQGAADVFSMVRFTTLPWTVDPVGAVQFNQNRLVFDGHSQGATTGPLALPYAGGLAGAVLSGCGGSLVYGLLGKKSPYDASVGVRAATQELQIDDTHPVLNLIQIFFDEVDPLTYAPLLYAKPVGKPLHVLHVFGLGDTYAPTTTQRVFAAATLGTMGVPDVPFAGFDNAADLGMAAAPMPIQGNVATAIGPVTGVTIERPNDPGSSTDGQPYDGHFVAYHDLVAVRQVAQFLGTLLQGLVPVVVKP